MKRYCLNEVTQLLTRNDDAEIGQADDHLSRVAKLARADEVADMLQASRRLAGETNNIKPTIQDDASDSRKALATRQKQSDKIATAVAEQLVEEIVEEEFRESF